MTDRTARFGRNIGNLRAHAARGTLVNSGFQVGIAGLGLIQRMVTAIFLTRAEFGLWAIVVTILVTLTAVKQLGIADKYIQQSDRDQEAAFQKAFTLELFSSVAFFVLVAVLLPPLALVLGQ